jgi:hypothetical protein
VAPHISHPDAVVAINSQHVGHVEQTCAPLAKDLACTATAQDSSGCRMQLTDESEGVVADIPLPKLRSAPASDIQASIVGITCSIKFNH